MTPNKSNQINNRTLLFFIFFLLTVILCFGCGYITKTYQVREAEGIDFMCLNYKDTIRSCNATIYFPSQNITMVLKSDFDNIKVMRKQ